MPSNKIFEVYEAFKIEFKDMGRKKSAKRSTVSCLYSCLKWKAYPHVLKWTEKEREFSILFRRKGSCNWDSSDLDFFKELDSLSPSKKEKYANQPDYDLGCKRRCKANLRKLCNDKIIEYIDKKMIDKSTKLKYYKFLEIPKDEELYHKPFVVTAKREMNDNVINARAKHNSPNVEENNNKKIKFCEESAESFCFNFNTSNNYELPEKELSYDNHFTNSNTSDNYKLPKMDFTDENCTKNTNNLDTYELPEMELSNVKEFLQIKTSLPGYLEFPKNSLNQNVPLWSYCLTPQIKNGMNIDEVADAL